MKTPSKVKELWLESTCTSISSREWDIMMQGTTKANGSQIRRLIKKHLPELYNSLALMYPNLFEHKCVCKPGLLVYVHSGIEYFLRYE